MAVEIHRAILHFRLKKMSNQEMYLGCELRSRPLIPLNRVLLMVINGTNNTTLFSYSIQQNKKTSSSKRIKEI